MNKRSRSRGRHVRHRHYLVPWLLCKSDILRYLGRALRACWEGRVLFFFDRDKRGTKALLAMVREPDYHKALVVAREDYKRGRVRKVCLADLRPIRRRLGPDRTVEHSTGGYSPIKNNSRRADPARSGGRDE